jgi:heat shock protein HslJ
MVDATGDWQLTRGTNAGAAIPLAGDVKVTMSVAGSKVSGRSGCNMYGGDIVVVAGKIQFGALSMTEMACQEPAMATEAAYLAALGKVRAATRDGDVLTLAGPGVELVFDRLVPPPPAALAGTTWTLDSIITGDSVSSVIGDPATLVLGADGSVTGFTGCHKFTARYTESNGAVRLSDIVPDLADCTTELTAQDAVLMAVLGSEMRASIDGQRLTLTGSDGRGLGYMGSPTS